MKQFKFILIGLIIGCLIGLLLYDTYLCSSDVIEVRYDSIIRKFDTVEVPIPYEVIEYVDKVKTIYKTDTFTIDLTQTIDSAQILADYVRTRLYKDTLRSSELVAYITHSIQFNRIKSRQFSYKILRPTQILANKPNSIGIGLTYYIKPIPIVTFNHNKWGLSVGYNQEIYLGVQYKLIQF